MASRRLHACVFSACASTYVKRIGANVCLAHVDAQWSPGSNAAFACACAHACVCANARADALAAQQTTRRQPLGAGSQHIDPAALVRSMAVQFACAMLLLGVLFAQSQARLCCKFSKRHPEVCNIARRFQIGVWWSLVLSNERVWQYQKQRSLQSEAAT